MGKVEFDSVASLVSTGAESGFVTTVLLDAVHRVLLEVVYPDRLQEVRTLRRLDEEGRRDGLVTFDLPLLGGEEVLAISVLEHLGVVARYTVKLERAIGEQYGSEVRNLHLWEARWLRIVCGVC